jgi:hypothetical protein
MIFEEVNELLPESAALEKVLAGQAWSRRLNKSVLGGREGFK